MRQELQEDRRAGDRVFDRAMGSEWLDIVGGRSARSETKEETSKAQPAEKNKDDDGPPGPARTL
jgi:hypothetical protein